MRLVIFVVVLAFNSIALRAQTIPEWSRVYTFDESIIDMNTSLVTAISKDINRVRFRWTFDQPQLLGGAPAIKYQNQLEVMEFNCSQKQYRPYHSTYFDATGNIVRIHDSPGKWQTVTSGSMIDKLFVPGCDLIRNKTRSVPKPDQLEEVALFASDFAKHLDQSKDFKLLVNRFFVANYLNGYLQDKKTNWFPNLKRDTAVMLSRPELERFYVSLMNAGYLSSLYLISQLPSDSEEPAAVEKLLPPDVVQLLKSQGYGDNFLKDDINSVERLRSYTDLLERISSLMRKHVERTKAAQSMEWLAMLDNWDLYQPKARTCTENCFGLPAGTRLFDVNVPVFRLQVAKVGENFKVVSAISRF